MVVIFAAAAAVAMLVVDETFLEESVGVVKSAVIMSLMMLVKLNRANHIDAGGFLLLPYKLTDMLHQTKYVYDEKTKTQSDSVVSIALSQLMRHRPSGAELIYVYNLEVARL